jgi:hypothetical protein
MQELTALLKAVAWPLIALTALIMLRAQVVALLKVLATKIERATRVKFTRSGFELADEILRNSIAPAVTRPTAVTPAERQGEFERLVGEYNTLNIADEAERIAARRRLADRLGELAISLNLARNTLAERDDEGRLVALATAVVQRPMAADLATLEKAAQCANFNFTRYRILLALVSALSQRRSMTAGNYRQAENVLTQVEHRPDAPTTPSLQRLIDSTRATLADMKDGA